MNDERPKLLTAAEVAEILRLSDTTIYEYARQGKIPGFKVGGTWRFPEREFWDWIRREIRRTEAERRSEARHGKTAAHQGPRTLREVQPVDPKELE